MTFFNFFFFNLQAFNIVQLFKYTYAHVHNYNQTTTKKDLSLSFPPSSIWHDDVFTHSHTNTLSRRLTVDTNTIMEPKQ